MPALACYYVRENKGGLARSGGRGGRGERLRRGGGEGRKAKKFSVFSRKGASTPKLGRANAHVMNRMAGGGEGGGSGGAGEGKLLGVSFSLLVPLGHGADSTTGD